MSDRIIVTCTCGTWQIDAEAAPETCPKCGASERYHTKGGGP